MKITPEKLIEFTKASVTIIGCWPPPKNVTKRGLLLRDLWFAFSFLVSFTLLLALINGIVAHFDDKEIVLQNTCFAMAMIQLCAKMSICRKERSRFQSITIEMENFVKQATDGEREILQKCADKFSSIHILITMIVYVTIASMILGPVVLPQLLPTFAKYPFNVDSHPLYVVAYLHQAFCGIEGGVAWDIDCQVALLLWFLAARFEILKDELTNVSSEDDLVRCIRKHLHLLGYADEVIETVRFIILMTAGGAATVMIVSGLLLISNTSVVTKSQFSFAASFSIWILFLCCNPAENLLEMSSAIGVAAYNFPWIRKSQKIRKSIHIVMQRCQRPVIISVGGMLPQLSLSYYMSFLSTSFSYFTTLRATMNSEE